MPGDQGEGHRQVLERVGGQQQGRPAEVQFVDAEGAAEAVQDPAAMVGQVEPPGLPVEAVVDEAVGEVEEKSRRIEAMTRSTLMPSSRMRSRTAWRTVLS